MKIKRLNHVGVIVESLADAERWLGEVYGLPVQRRIELAESKIQAVFYTCGEVQIEAIEIGDPDERRRRLGTGVRARIEHIALEVEDIADVMKALAPLGVRTTMPQPRRTGDYASIWTVPATSGDVSWQFTQKVRS